MDLDEGDEVDGDSDSGAKPESLKYGWRSASLAVILWFGLKQSIFCSQKERKKPGKI